RGEAADAVEGDGDVLAHPGEGLPADALLAGVAWGFADGADHGEIAAQGVRGSEFFHAVAGRGQGDPSRDGALALPRQLRSAEMEADAVGIGEIRVAVHEDLCARTAAATYGFVDQPAPTAGIA